MAPPLASFPVLTGSSPVALQKTVTVRLLLAEEGKKDEENESLQPYSLLTCSIGSNDYPHQYNNYEGFDFPDKGPWYEFPILSSGSAYTGGQPGADRVVFNYAGEFQDAITHTGASGNNFVGCT
ncbi:hypothetical protein RRF57_007466 [Xylaria bambusicola]|uniref:ribonuclease T1 n=1 Tax=Xylaria bambusicola TaxID=326684 RepID=A0AAN7UMT4_9PEZI